MKKTIFLCLIIALIIGSCSQKAKVNEKAAKIENTLISVALFTDSVGVDPSKVLQVIERRNKAVDSLGYPDAGYKLWLVKGDSIKNFRFMTIGSWPNQAIYDSIHKNKIYLRSLKLTPEEEAFGIKTYSYYRFTLVK
jgi:hypothetical protein